MKTDLDNVFELARLNRENQRLKNKVKELESKKYEMEIETTDTTIRTSYEIFKKMTTELQNI